MIKQRKLSMAAYIWARELNIPTEYIQTKTGKVYGTHEELLALDAKLVVSTKGLPQCDLARHE